MPLRGKDRRYLRSLGHHIKPVVQVGKEGVTEALLVALGHALDDHELVKVKITENAPLGRDEAGAALEGGTGGEVVQMIGNTLLIYRKNMEKPKLTLPW